MEEDAMQAKNVLMDPARLLCPKLATVSHRCKHVLVQLVNNIASGVLAKTVVVHMSHLKKAFAIRMWALCKSQCCNCCT